MKTILRWLLPLTLALAAQAATPRTLSVTGVITALTEQTITVAAGEELWEISRAAATEVDGKLALGSRVTVRYKLVAERIEVKGAPTKAPPPVKSDLSTEKADQAAEKAAKRAK